MLGPQRRGQVGKRVLVSLGAGAAIPLSERERPTRLQDRVLRDGQAPVQLLPMSFLATRGSRSASLSASRTSAGEIVARRTRPDRRRSSIAIGGSQNGNQWAGEDPGEEPATLATPTGELVRREEGVVNRAGQLGFRLGDRFMEDDFLYRADDEEVNITGGGGRARRLTAVYHGQGDVTLQRDECRAQHIRQAHRFQDEAVHLREGGTGPVRAVVDFSSAGFVGEEARVDQSLQFALDPTLTGLDLAGDLA